jgi:hypothetical protein
VPKPKVRDCVCKVWGFPDNKFTEQCCKLSKGNFVDGDDSKVCRYDRNHIGTGSQDDFANCCEGPDLGTFSCNDNHNIQYLKLKKKKKEK